MKRPMIQWLPLLSGSLFAIGLAVGGMTQPAKVVRFLDVFGDWDPSLAFVMGGAIAAFLPLHRLVLRRRRPLSATRFRLPTRQDIDGRLILGASLFGVGWGLGGFCPGPALASVFSGASSSMIFVVMMLAGMGIHTLLSRCADAS